MGQAIDKTAIFKKYENKWVALTDDDKVVGIGSTLDEALNEAHKKNCKNPVITKIPDLKYDYLLFISAG